MKGARAMSAQEAAKFKNQAQISIEELNTAETLKCLKCQGVVWGQGVVIKKTSALSIGGEQVVQLPVMFCQMCGTPLPNSCPVNI